MYKILLCCNTPGMLSTASDLLASTGSFEITMCEEGADAGMELAGREHFDLFVVNISDLPEFVYSTVYFSDISSRDCGYGSGSYHGVLLLFGRVCGRRG